MKKVKLFLMGLLLNVFAFAYNPPVGSQAMFNLSSPTQLTYASSAAGSGIFNVGPDSIVFNPALTAMEQRIQLDTDYSAIFSTKYSSFNSAFQTGILIPYKWLVLSGYLNGTFSSAPEMELGNSMNLKIGIAKEVSEKISVGMNLATGIFWEDKVDWALGVDLGVLYRREYLGFAKDFRVGVALLNLGKYYKTNLVGINEDYASDYFPSIATLKLGVGTVLLETKNFNIGASFDITSPTFQNAIFDTGLQFGVKDTVFLSVAESIDIREAVNGHYSFMPAIGVTVKFMFNSKNNEYLKAHDWDQSEMITSAAWQQKYESLQVVSGGLKLKLGLKDTTPPVIKLWDEE